MYPFKSKKPVTVNHQLLDYPKVSIQLNNQKRTDIAFEWGKICSMLSYILIQDMSLAIVFAGNFSNSAKINIERI